jgi:MATE family multidrug resistance protein
MSKLDMAGSGYADSLAAWITLPISIVYLWAKGDIRKYELFKCTKNCKENLPVLSDLVKNGLPIVAQSLITTIGYSGLATIRGLFGEDGLLAQMIIAQTLSYFAGVEGSIAQATAVLVGKELGAENAHSAKKTGNIGLILGASVALAGEVLFVVVPEVFIGAFIDLNNPVNLPIVDLTKQLFIISGLTSLSDSLSLISQGGLRAFKCNSIGIVANIAKAGATLSFSYLFGFTLDWELVGIAYAEFIGSSVGTVISLVGWYRKNLNKHKHEYVPI